MPVERDRCMVSQNDYKMVAAIHQVCDRGGNVQVKKSRDGTLKVQEIKVQEVTIRELI